MCFLPYWSGLNCCISSPCCLLGLSYSPEVVMGILGVWSLQRPQRWTHLGMANLWCCCAPSSHVWQILLIHPAICVLQHLLSTLLQRNQGRHLRCNLFLTFEPETLGGWLLKLQLGLELEFKFSDTWNLSPFSLSIVSCLRMSIISSFTLVLFFKYSVNT